MKSIVDKTDTLRTATAQCVLRATEQAIDRLSRNDLPKKDALPIARAAGVLAAKKTHELIPYCHPIPIDSIRIEFEISGAEIRLTATVASIWKTGVEMEALTAASVAALTLYDMLKPVEKNLEILSCKLALKTGGKSDFIEKIPPGFKAAVLVTSDGTSQGRRQDKSGRIIQEKLRGYGIEPLYEVLPDEKNEIISKMKKWCEDGILLIVTTGGTGLGFRDVTVEAAREIIDREIPGIMEAARVYGQQRTPYAMLSRGLAGQKGRTIILTLPGSSKGAEESLNAVFPAVLHAYKMMGGGGH